MLFGSFLVREGVISPAELEAALILQQERNPRIGRLARRHQLLCFSKICEIIEHQKKRQIPFGKAAIELGLLSQLEVDRLIEEQSSVHIRLGELLVELHVLSAAKLQQCLAAFFAENGPMGVQSSTAAVSSNGCGHPH